MFLGISTVPPTRPLQPHIHISGCFNAPMLARSKAMPHHCRYCRQEGHLISVCPTCPPRCRHCGEAGHLASETFCPEHPSHASRKKAAALQHSAEMASTQVESDLAAQDDAPTAPMDSTSPTTPPAPQPPLTPPK
ncbi:hypothetical protein CLU79DRAFT_758800 [Phycomyces nitens]|nr:hypothetical protein CLU79DRAFT_758800 [Phycomyces nitens]